MIRKKYEKSSGSTVKQKRLQKGYPDLFLITQAPNKLTPRLITLKKFL